MIDSPKSIKGNQGYQRYQGVSAGNCDPTICVVYKKILGKVFYFPEFTHFVGESNISLFSLAILFVGVLPQCLAGSEWLSFLEMAPLNDNFFQGAWPWAASRPFLGTPPPSPGESHLLVLSLSKQILGRKRVRGPHLVPRVPNGCFFPVN